MDTQTRRLCQVTGFLGLRPPGSQGSLQFPPPPPQLLCLRFQGTCPCCQPQYLLALTADVLRERHLHIRGWVSSTDLQELGARGKGKRECLGLLSALPTALARLPVSPIGLCTADSPSAWSGSRQLSPPAHKSKGGLCPCPPGPPVRQCRKKTHAPALVQMLALPTLRQVQNICEPQLAHL